MVVVMAFPHIRVLSVVILAVWALGPIAAQNPPPPRPAPAVPAAPPAALNSESLDDKTKLNVGDQILFRIPEDRDPSKTLQVLDSGEINFPYIGRVKAAGKTPRQLALELKPLFEKDYYHQATVLITLDTQAKFKGSIFVSGEVGRPGTLQMPGDRRFMASEAIIAAGGFKDFADQRKVRVIRKSEAGQSRELIVDVKAVLDEGKLDKDLELQAEDRVIVRAKLVNF